MKKYFLLIIVILFAIIFLSGVTSEEKKLVGYYEQKIDDETIFLVGDYDIYNCLVLFEDGRFVIYEKKVNRKNPVDLVFTPKENGVFHVHKELLFIEPDNRLFYIYNINGEELIGTHSGKVYIKR